MQNLVLIQLSKKLSLALWDALMRLHLEILYILLIFASLDHGTFDTPPHLPLVPIVDFLVIISSVSGLPFRKMRDFNEI